MRLFQATCAIYVFVSLVAAANAITITSNDFDAFAATVAGAPAGTTIDFNLGANSTIHFTRRIELSSNISFVGNNAVTFDGDNNTSLHAMFYVLPSATANFSGLTFQNGYSPNAGGAIIAAGPVNIANSSFFHNTAENAGGAIDAFSQVNVVNSSFIENTAGNAGAAMSTDGLTGQLNVTDSSFFHNTAGNVGGGIYGNMHVVGSVFAFNLAGNTGGGVAAGGTSVDLLIENSTFYANTAGNVGGAVDSGAKSIVIRNSTIFGNQAGLGGGVILDSRGTLTVESSIIAGNHYDDLFIDPNLTSSFSMDHSLIGSSAHNNVPNGVNGNLVGNGTTVAGFPIANLLGSLGNNGGPTQTMAP